MQSALQSNVPIYKQFVRQYTGKSQNLGTNSWLQCPGSSGGTTLSAGRDHEGLAVGCNNPTCQR